MSVVLLWFTSRCAAPQARRPRLRLLEIKLLTLQSAKLKCMLFGRNFKKINEKLEQRESSLKDPIAEEGVI